MTTGRLLNISEAAEALGRHRATITRWVDQGEIRTVRAGKRRWIPASEIERLTTSPPNAAQEIDQLADDLPPEVAQRVRDALRAG